MLVISQQYTASRFFCFCPVQKCQNGDLQILLEYVTGVANMSIEKQGKKLAVLHILHS